MLQFGECFRVDHESELKFTFYKAVEPKTSNVLGRVSKKQNYVFRTFHILIITLRHVLGCSNLLSTYCSVGCACAIIASYFVIVACALPLQTAASIIGVLLRISTLF